jgi:uncharacterized protein DUF6941
MPSNVDFSQLRAFLFCRGVQQKKTGITLVDIHDTRLTSTFPAAFPELWIYLSFETSRQEEVALELKVRLPNGDMDTVATSSVAPDASRVILAPIDLQQFEFIMPGRHSFAVYADDVLVGCSALTIEAIPHLTGARTADA